MQRKVWGQVHVIHVSNVSTPSLSSSSAEPDSDTAGSSSSSGSGVASILDRLKCPRPLDLARKRKIAANPPSTGKRTCHGHGGTPLDPKNVNPASIK